MSNNYGRSPAMNAVEAERRRQRDIVDRLRRMGDRDEGLPWSACHEAADEIERLRAALQACIKSAEADDPLKESGWWNEQSIIAIEQARKLLEKDK